VVVVEVKEEGTILSSSCAIHKCKSHKRSIGCRRDDLGSKCFVQAPLQVVDDDVVEVVDVILIWVNGWGIHPLREATIFIIIRELKNTQKMLTNQAWLMIKYHFHSLPLLVGSVRSDDRSCPNPRRLASRNADRVNMLATTSVC
jgi:hypothetical protein